MDPSTLRSMHTLELGAFRAREATAYLLVAVNGCPEEVAAVWEGCVARMAAALDEAHAAHRAILAGRGPAVGVT